MKDYRHILLAVDVESPFQERLVQLAIETCRNVPTTLLYVIERMPIFDFEFPQALVQIAKFEEERIEHAEFELAKMGRTLQVPASRQLIKTGEPKTKIIDVAKIMQADLIILGNHAPQHHRLVGSTAKAILNHANCDVLALRVHDDELKVKAASKSFYNQSPIENNTASPIRHH